MQTRKITTNSAEETEQLAEKIGAALRGGEVIELSSDLGGGKTTFVRGLVRGAGSKDHVTSPTFTISNEYHIPPKKPVQGPSLHKKPSKTEANKTPKSAVQGPSSHIDSDGSKGLRVIRHFDFYRLPDAGLIEHELEDYIGHTDTVVVIEWAKIIKNVLPKEYIQIEIVSSKEDTREIVINTPESLKYIIG